MARAKLLTYKTTSTKNEKHIKLQHTQQKLTSTLRQWSGNNIMECHL